MNITEKIIKSAIFLYAALFITLALSPIIFYLITNEMMPAMPFYLPNMIADTFCNFILVVYVHSAILLAAVCFVAAFDTLTVVLFVNMFMVAMVIVKDVEEFGSFLKWEEYSPKIFKLRLIKIIGTHKMYNE